MPRRSVFFWPPPPDLAPGEELSFLATVDDLRGHRASSRNSGPKLEAAVNALLATNTPAFGAHGATAATYGVPQASAALAGHYRVLVRVLAGTALGRETVVTVAPARTAAP